MFNKTKLNNQPTLDTAKLFKLTTYLKQEKNHYIHFLHTTLTDTKIKNYST